MNIDKPTVSIGMPVYNGEPFLREAIESILDQTFKNFELIISDNASTDGTEKICREYAAKDSRIHYYRNEENRGAAWNYNRVVALSRGKYFKWAAHDDKCAPEFLEQCIRVLDQEPSVVLCYTKTIIIDEHGKHLKNFFPELDLRSPNVCERYKRYRRYNYGHKPGQCNPIWGVLRTDILRKTHLIGNYLASDRTLLGEIAFRGEFYEVPEPLFFRRIHPGQSMKANPTSKERILWFDSANKRKILVRNWKHFFEFFNAINHAEISWQQKLYCYAQTLRWTPWKSMAKELVHVARHFLLAARKMI